MQAKTFGPVFGMLGAVIAVTGVAVGAALAQSAPPSYQGDPSVYKVIYEDANFRVIEGTRKAGMKDKLHGHPLPGIVYNLTDCPTKLYSPDGKVVERTDKAGAASATPVIPSHQAENVGTADCKQIFVEKK
jgi:hypothetical protein